ncbi:MAG: filamentous hemagglutinin N-terminal domain-containing protein, partial [Gammaproteobacteria bacterium]|nr:filamentous hemagglutinin N-terminal domain-containing protein [Gammaproteobacteria bacterium]
MSSVLTSLPVIAAPQGGAIVAGQGNITTPSSSVTQVQQLSNNLVVDWQSFNVNANELVQFSQPTSTSAVLNRINDVLPSEIYGSIEANGLVFLMNPNGMLFGEGANIQVNGLFATNLNIDSSRFMAGDYAFESMGMIDGKIVNQGIISASTGGVSLVSDTGVVNEGQILATVGSVNLAVAKSATLDFTGDGMLQLSVSGEVLENAQALDEAIKNTGEIVAEGGDVLISGQVARDVFTNVVNNTGIIKATRVINEGGVIMLAGPSGDISNSGTLDVSGAEAGEIVVTAENIAHSGLIDASATEGDGGSVTLQSSNDTFLQGQSLISASADNGVGGTVHVLGNRVGLFDQSSIDASGLTGGGEILIGGDYQGKNAAIQNATRTLVTANVNLNADAIQTGDGGKIIVWSDEVTQFYGDISATGGNLFGDGGFAEVSGKQSLDFSGFVNLSAVNGANGLLLLDPDNVTVVNNGSDVLTSIDEFADTVCTNCNVDDGTIESVLFAGTDVLIQANDDITIDNRSINGTNSSGTTSTLTLLAGDDIIINNDINVAGDGINLVLSAGDAGATPTAGAESTADIFINGLISLGGGTFSATTRTNGVITGGSITAGAAADIITAAEVSFDAIGSIDVNTDAPLLSATSSTGTIKIDSTYSAGDVEIGTAGAVSGITTTDQTITLNSVDAGFNITQAVNAGASTVAITASDSGTTGDYAVSGTGVISSAGLTISAESAIDVVTATVNTSTVNLTTTSDTGDITVVEGNDLIASDVSITTNGNAQTIDISANSWDIDAAVIADATDTLVLRATGGDINDAAGTNTITATALAMQATGNINVASNAATIAANSSAGSIVINSAYTGSDLIVGSVIGGAGTITGLSAVDNTVTLNSAEAGIDIQEAISAGNGAINLTTTEAAPGSFDYDITDAGSPGTISTSGVLTVNADGLIDINTDLDGGTLNVTTSGAAAAGNITVVDTGASAITLSGVTTETDNQTIDLTSGAGWDVNASFGDANDSIALTATTGNIEGTGTITAADLTLTASDGGIGTLAAVNTAITGDINLETGGAGTLGNIDVSNSKTGLSTLNSVVTNTTSSPDDAQAVNLVASEGWDIQGSVGDVADTIQIVATTGNIEGAGTVTAADLTLTATTGGIGTLAAINTAAAAVSFETGGAGILGNIDVSNTHTGLTALNGVTTAADNQVINLLAREGWDIQGDAGDTNDTMTLTATAGDIDRSSGTAVLTAAALVLDAQAGGIGIGGAVDASAASISLITGGAGTGADADSGDIFFATTGGFSVSAFSGNISTDATTGQTIELSADSWNIDGASIGDANDSLVLNAASLGFSGVGTLTAAAIGLSATGANDINVITNAGSVAASTGTGDISITSSYNAGTLTVDAVGTLSGISTNGGTITLTSTDASIDVVESINAGAGAVTIATLDSGATGDYDISGTGGVATTGLLTLEADGGVTGLNVDLQATGTVNVASHGAGALGNVTLVDTSAMLISQIIGLTTDGIGTQSISWSADSWNIDGSTGNTADNLSLTATNGIAFTVGTLSAANLNLTASGGDIGTSPSKVSTNVAGTLTADGSNIYISDTNTGALTLGAINAGAGAVELVAANGFDGSGTITAGTLNLLALNAGAAIGSSGISIMTDISGALTAKTNNGDIYLSDAGSLLIDKIDAGAGDVELSAVGSISDAAGADTVVDIYAKNLTIDTTAGAGVSASDALNLQVAELIITNSTGDFFLTNAGALTLREVTAGSIDLFASGDLTVRGNVTTSAGGIALSSAGILSVLDDGNSSLISSNSTGGGASSIYTTNTYDYGAVALDTNGTGDISLVSNDIRIQTAYSTGTGWLPNGSHLYLVDPILMIYISVPDYLANIYEYPDATLNAGANSVIFDTYTASNTLALGSMLTNAE